MLCRLTYSLARRQNLFNQTIGINFYSCHQHGSILFGDLINDKACIKKSLKLYKLSEKWSPFFVLYLCILKINIKLNILSILLLSNKLESRQIYKYLSQFQGATMVDHNLEIPRPVVFGVKCFNWDT